MHTATDANVTNLLNDNVAELNAARFGARDVFVPSADELQTHFSHFPSLTVACLWLVELNVSSLSHSPCLSAPLRRS